MMRGQEMKATLTQAPKVKTSFLKLLWRAMLRFDEALNYDSHDDLAHRIAEVERERDVQRGTIRGSSRPE
jgi:hypothetical protein